LNNILNNSLLHKHVSYVSIWRSVSPYDRVYILITDGSYATREHDCIHTQPIPRRPRRKLLLFPIHFLYFLKQFNFAFIAPFLLELFNRKQIQFLMGVKENLKTVSSLYGFLLLLGLFNLRRENNNMKGKETQG